MKKIFLIFVCFLIIVSCMVLPCLAHMPSRFGDHPNYLNSNYGTISRFYTSPTKYTEEYFFTTYLKPDTNYTFYSTTGTKCLYIGEQVVYNNYYSAFSYDSLNLLKNFTPRFESSTINGVTCTLNSNGSFTINGVSSTDVSFPLYSISLNNSNYSLYNLSGSIGGVTTWHMSFEGTHNGSYFDYRDYGSGVTFDGNGKSGTLYFTLRGGSVADNLVIYPMLVEGSEVLPFEIPYIDPVFNDEFTYVYNFRTPSSITTDTLILVGINDVTQFNDSDKFFSRYQADSGSIHPNDFYLIEGFFTPDELANIDLESSYNSGYNSGYDDGYKIGETDGLSSTSFMRSTIFTILSAPFVIVSNALDFDLLGINIYNLVKVSITVLLIAWIITRLKGRE